MTQTELLKAALKERVDDEPIERAIYRKKCKHYGMEGTCYLHSGWSGMCHILSGCNGNCRRMKRYDKLHQKDVIKS